MPRILRGLPSLKIDVFVLGCRDLVRAQNLKRVSNKFKGGNIYSQKPGVRGGKRQGERNLNSQGSGIASSGKRIL